MKIVKLLTILSVLLAGVVIFASTSSAQNIYTAKPTKENVVVPKTTVLEPTTDEVVLSVDLGKDVKKVYWEVYDQDNPDTPEATSTELTPKFKFKKDGVKDVVLTVTDSRDVQAKTKYELVVTLKKPIINTAKQVADKLVINGTAAPKSEVIVYIHSHPLRLKTTADDQGFFEVSVAIDKVGYGEHTVTAVSASSKALQKISYLNKIDDIVIAQINNQLGSGVLLKKDGDVPLLVAQPIASEPKKVTLFGMSQNVLNTVYTVIGVIFIVLFVIIFKHLKRTFEDLSKRTEKKYSAA